VIGVDLESGGHGVASVSKKMVTAGVEGFVDVEPFDAACGALSAVVFESDHDDGSSESFDEFGGDDSNHADMPSAFGEDEDGVLLISVGMGFDVGDGLLGDGFLEFLSGAVLPVEVFGEFFGLVGIVCGQQIEGLSCVPHSSGGVDPRGEEEGDVVAFDSFVREFDGTEQRLKADE